MIQTGIFKVPVEARVRVRAFNIDGDQQPDLTVHGGPRGQSPARRLARLLSRAPGYSGRLLMQDVLQWRVEKHDKERRER